MLPRLLHVPVMTEFFSLSLTQGISLVKAITTGKIISVLMRLIAMKYNSSCHVTQVISNFARHLPSSDVNTGENL